MDERPRARDFLRGPNGLNGIQMLLSCLMTAVAEADEKGRLVMVCHAEVREGVPSFTVAPVVNGRGGRPKPPKHPAVLVYPDGRIELHGGTSAIEPEGDPAP